MSPRRADFLALIGATGSGKSLRVRELLTQFRPRRLILCDPMDEYAGFAERAASCQAIHAAAQQSSFAVRFAWSRDSRVRRLQFNALCEIALKAGRCWFVVEELGDVDSPNPYLVMPGWDEICRVGRHDGLTVIGCAQDPTMVNKRFFNAARLIRCGCLNEEPHVRKMANTLRVPYDEVANLRPLEYVERDRDARVIRKGRIALPGAKKTGRASP